MDFSLFFQNVLIAGKQVLILYIIAMVGFLCDKTGVFTESISRKANNLLFYIITPCVIINSFISTEFSPDSALRFAIAGLAAALTFTIGIIISLPFFRKGDINKAAVYKFASVYGNMGYMALPLAKAVLGDEGVFYCSAGVIVFQLFCFTHGVYIMTKGEKSGFNLKSILVNPGVIGVVIGLPLFLFNVNADSIEIISKPISLIGGMQTPFAMLMFGTYISHAGFKGMLKNKQQYIVLLLKLITTPLIMLGVMTLAERLLPSADQTSLITSALMTSVVIQAAAPSANNTAMFAAKYDKDAGLASQVVAFVSLVSIITLPIMIALTQ